MAEIKAHLTQYRYRNHVNIRFDQVRQYLVVLFNGIDDLDPEHTAVSGPLVMPPVLASVATEFSVGPASIGNLRTALQTLPCRTAGIRPYRIDRTGKRLHFHSVSHHVKFKSDFTGRKIGPQNNNGKINVAKPDLQEKVFLFFNAGFFFKET